MLSCIYYNNLTEKDRPESNPKRELTTIVEQEHSVEETIRKVGLEKLLTICEIIDKVLWRLNRSL